MKPYIEHNLTKVSHDFEMAHVIINASVWEN